MGKKFSLELATFPKELEEGKSPFERFRWPISAQVTLGDIVLGEKNCGRDMPFQNPGYDFVPDELVKVGLTILNGQPAGYYFNDEKQIPLRFEPVETDQVRISLIKEHTTKVYAGFDIAKVVPVLDTRKNVAFEFFNFYNKLVEYTAAYPDKNAKRALSELVEGALLMQGPQIAGLFREKACKLFYNSPVLSTDLN